MNSKGFTLVEIMVTVVILAVVVALTIPVYTKVVNGITAVSAGEDSKIDNILAMEIIRLDLQHVGTGIGGNETTPPLVYVEPAAPPVTPNSPVLDLRSTLVNTNQSTLGWAIINCTAPGAAITAGDYVVDEREVQTNTDLVLLNSSKDYVANTNAGYNCPAVVGLFSAFPNAAGAAGANACATGFCTNIRYNLSAAQNLETCAAGTRNLVRTVGAAIAGDALVNCVAGFRVRFDIDANTDGRIVPPGETELTALPGTASQIMAQVRNIDMYLLVQSGNEDRSLNTQPTLTVDGIDFTPDLAGVTNANNYRWKIYKISGKPNSWL